MLLSGAAWKWKSEKPRTVLPPCKNRRSGIREQELKIEGRSWARVVLVIVLAVFTTTGCAHRITSTAPAAAPRLTGDSAHPGRTHGWVDTKLYFGLGPADRPEQGISEMAWRDFLDKEVTPRFPAGLSVLDVYGQWESKGSSTPERLRSKLLVIDHPDDDENRAKIDAIRAAWKLKTGDQSVLMVTVPADISF